MTTLSRRDFLVSVVALSGTVAATAAHLHLPAKAAAATLLPDLIITALTFPTGIAVGQLVTFGVTVKNQGTVATPTAKEIGVGFYVDGRYIGWSGTDYTALAAGGSITLRANGGGTSGAGTWPATAGPHTVEAVVNDVHRFPEVSWSNNSMSATFTVAAATKPVNTALPVITGTPAVGSVLSVSNGSWS